ncbi:MAG: hypothetical protein WCA89_12245 [Terracidiphilus sp.]
MKEVGDAIEQARRVARVGGLTVPAEVTMREVFNATGRVLARDTANAAERMFLRGLEEFRFARVVQGLAGAWRFAAGPVPIAVLTARDAYNLTAEVMPLPAPVQTRILREMLDPRNAVPERPAFVTSQWLADRNLDPVVPVQHLLGYLSSATSALLAGELLTRHRMAHPEFEETDRRANVLQGQMRQQDEIAELNRRMRAEENRQAVRRRQIENLGGPQAVAGQVASEIGTALIPFSPLTSTALSHEVDVESRFIAALRARFPDLTEAEIDAAWRRYLEASR